MENEELINKTKILLVDDDSAVAGMCKRVLESNNYYVETVSSGRDALAILNNKFFNMVLADIKLPGDMDGIALLKEIRHKYPSVIVIIMTAYGTIETAITTMKEGACDYLIKPFDIHILLNTVRRSLEFCRLKSESEVLLNAISLFEFVSETSSDKTGEELLSLLLGNALKIMRANSGSVFVYNKITEKLEMMTCIGMEEKIKKEVSIGEGIVGYVARSRKTLILHNGLHKYPLFKTYPPRKEIVSSIINPILLKGMLLGVLCLNKTEDTPVLFSDEDKRIIKMFSNYAALVIGSFQASAELLFLNRLKSEFLSNVSHELRTPLMAISGAAELLDDPTPSKNKKQMLELIQRNVQRMDKLVADLLDFSKMESGKLIYNFRKTRISNVLNKLIMDFENEFRKKEIKFIRRIQEGIPPIVIDSERMYQAVSNLLTNTLKFTPLGGEVELRCSKNKTCVMVSVKDTGIGISKKYHDKIYSNFFQVDGSSTRNERGLGLGLAIANSIVSAHKGKIKLKSEPGKGSTFTIYLPCSNAMESLRRTKS